MAAGGESIPRLYSRTGDHGTTALHGGSRIDKDSLRVRAYGTYDELGAILGLVETELPAEPAELKLIVHRLQNELFLAQSELATPAGDTTPRHRIEARHVDRLEADIDRFEHAHKPLHSFVLSGGSRPGALLHLARTVARRAEREVWALHRSEPLSPELLRWTNRLSGLLFALAIATNHHLGVPEVPPDYSV